MSEQDRQESVQPQDPRICFIVENPQTAREYWMEIEESGRFLYSTDPCVDHRSPERKAEDAKLVSPVARRSNRLAQEACERFNLTHPRDMRPDKLGDKPKPPREGTISYWDWYETQKKEFEVDLYNSTICSACPLSDGERILSYRSCSMYSMEWGTL